MIIIYHGNRPDYRIDVRKEDLDPTVASPVPPGTALDLQFDALRGLDGEPLGQL